MKAAGFALYKPTHLDHIGILCELLGIPLILTEESLVEAAHLFYPHLSIEKRTMAEVGSFEKLDAFDFLFFTCNIWAYETYVCAKEIYNKSTRIVYCPHGNSDKGHSISKYDRFPPSDIHLYYGQHMRDLLEERGSLIKIRSMIRTGNYRLNYYKKRRAFYDQLTERLIFSRFKNKKKPILYAPTRDSHEGPTSFFDSCGILIEELPKNYNLIVKLHPDLFEEFPAQTYRMIGKYSQHEGVLFVENFPPIYPLLARCACYLGDYSSVGYDFLAFNRPLFFVESHNKGLMRSAPTIRQCGMTIPFGKGIFPFIEKHIEENQQTYSSAREKMYSYTFGKDRDISDIKQELLYTS